MLRITTSIRAKEVSQISRHICIPVLFRPATQGIGRYDHIQSRKYLTVSSCTSKPWFSGRVTLYMQKTTKYSTLITILTPPAVFAGLIVVLWAYKCLMMIVFQNKIIYMPSVPPYSRRETISQHQPLCGSILWEQVSIKSSDGTRISLCVGSDTKTNENATKETVVLYFQGYVIESKARGGH